jgi:hypothetical protein
MMKQNKQNAQYSIEENQLRELTYPALRFTIKVHSKDSVVLVKEWTNRSMEQNRGPRNSPKDKVN